MPFALGRPLGAAGDTDFQKNVLRASFAMLQSAVEPTIEDYPIEAPVESGSSEWSCPVSFAVVEDESISARLLAEINPRGHGLPKPERRGEPIWGDRCWTRSGGTGC